MKSAQKRSHRDSRAPRANLGPALTVVGLAAGVSLWAATARAALVEVEVTGVNDNRGHIHVDICTQGTFLKDSCPYSGDADAIPGATVVTVAGVPPGEYAVQAFHDETGEGVIHQNVLGIPREPIGFSNDAPLHLRGPRFSDAAFVVNRDVERITLKLRHLFRRSP